MFLFGMCLDAFASHFRGELFFLSYVQKWSKIDPSCSRLPTSLFPENYELEIAITTQTPPHASWEYKLDCVVHKFISLIYITVFDMMLFFDLASVNPCFLWDRVKKIMTSSNFCTIWNKTIQTFDIMSK